MKYSIGYSFLALFLPVYLLVAAQANGEVNLSKMMTPEEQKMTGLTNLSPAQKKALEGWIDQNFMVKTEQMENKEQLSLSLNINGGKKILLSDHSLYEIAPADVDTASVWLSPVTIEIQQSGDPDYPVKLVNLDANQSVKAKKLNQ